MREFTTHGVGKNLRVTWDGPGAGSRHFATQEEAAAWVREQQDADLHERELRRSPNEEAS